MMRVLHLFSNCKWTGPAEPALNLCAALREQGVETAFACAPDAGNSVNRVVTSARERGITPILDFHLKKHRHPFKNLEDVRGIRRLLHAEYFDVVHCHLDNDHAIAGRAVRNIKIPLVRSSYEGLGLKEDRRHQRMLDRTALLIEPSEIALEHDRATFGLEPERVTVVPGAIDTHRFDPKRVPNSRRAALGIPEDAYVVGIVARMQTHRHFEDLLQVMRQLMDVMPNAHLLIVGRGTHQQRVVEDPARDMGMADHVHITGFIDGDAFVSAIQSMDTGVYLVPGSDGTCRAAREILSMGKPLVVADRGMLREIVVDGESGMVTDGSVAALFEAIHRLGQDPEKRHTMGHKARQHAEQHFALAAQAKAVKALYTQLLAR